MSLLISFVVARLANTLASINCYISIAGAQQNIGVWIVGSSIVRNAFLAARQRPGGINLNLHKMGVNILWQGRGGLKLDNLKHHIRLLMTLDALPSYIVVHVGGNDLGDTRFGFLVYRVKRFLSWLSLKLPNTMLIWSQILPRTHWRFSSNVKAMERLRKRLNSTIGAYMKKHGGAYIRYPDIKNSSRFLLPDGVHLSSLGNEIFLNNLQCGLEQVLSKK